MIQIRNNCFETNSSSSHSLIIKPGFDYYSSQEVFNELKYELEEAPDSPGKFRLKPWRYDYEEGFNRAPFQVLTTFRMKLFYLYAHAPLRKYPPKQGQKYARYYPEYYRVTNYIKKYLPWLEGIDWPTSEKPSSEAHEFAGVLKEHGIDWYEFLFDKSIIVICDGDEYCIWSTMKEQGLVNLPNGTKEYTYG